MKIGSLFAGIGGFDLGFEQSGWECAWQVESDNNCRRVLAHHWPDVPRHTDVRDAHNLEPVDVVTFGFPCQDLSVAGERAGLDGTRSNLFFEATRIIGEMRDASGGRHPTWVVAENVPGLLTADRGAAMGRCLDALAGVGAVGIEWAMLDSQHFGVPQRRRRMFIAAWFDPRAEPADPLFSVAASCQRHPQPGATTGPASTSATRAGVTTVGTLTAHLGKGGVDDNHAQAGHLIVVQTSSGVRRLTPLECERLQGFPDDHTRCDAQGDQLSDSARYRMLGNAVTVPVAKWIGATLATLNMEYPA